MADRTDQIVTRNDIIARAATSAGVEIEEAREIISRALDEIASAVAREERVVIQHFGVFYRGSNNRRILTSLLSPRYASTCRFAASRGLVQKLNVW